MTADSSPCGCDETQEPTCDDLDAMAHWSWSENRRQYMTHLCSRAADEERWSNWQAGLGYRLDAEVAR